jgi:hypothetical protein
MKTIAPPCSSNATPEAAGRAHASSRRGLHGTLVAYEPRHIATEHCGPCDPTDQRQPECDPGPEPRQRFRPAHSPGAWLRVMAAKLIGIWLAERPAPFADGCERHDNSTFELQCFDIEMAEAETVQEPPSVADDLSREMVRGCGRWIVTNAVQPLMHAATQWMRVVVRAFAQVRAGRRVSSGAYLARSLYISLCEAANRCSLSAMACSRSSWGRVRSMKATPM